MGGLVTLVSSQLLSIFRVLSIDSFEFEGLESQCILFERCDVSRDDLPAQFLILNCYVAAHPCPFAFDAFYSALEAFLLAHELPVVIVGDFNAHWKTASSRLPTPRDRDFREFVLWVEDAGFTFFPSSARDLHQPTYLSSQGNTVINYIFVRGVPVSNFHCEQLTTFGHRALGVKLNWPLSPRTILRVRTS